MLKFLEYLRTPYLTWPVNNWDLTSLLAMLKWKVERINTMLTRKIISQRKQLIVNLPSQICQTFNWKKGDVLGFVVLTRGVVQIEKLEIPEREKPKVAPTESEISEN